MIEVRPARIDDDAALARIDAATWSVEVSPAERPELGMPFFGERTRIEEVLVAQVDGIVAGYAKLRQAMPLPSHKHVLELSGLAVDAGRRRCGLGRRLAEEAILEAGRSGARKLSLRVLASNTAARRLYESCGFTVEGVLRGEFLLGGRYVDDVLMAREL